MIVALRTLERRVFPRGLFDAVWQLALFGGAYVGYQIVRGLVDGNISTAFWNATKVINLEHATGTFVEPSVQAWTQGSSLLMTFADWMYLNSHYTVTISALAFVYFFRNGSFYFVRNMFMVAMGIALVGYALYPTAPPRLMPEWGFTDSVANWTGVRIDNDKASALLNLYAAVPSMHVCFSLMIGTSMSRLVKRRPFKVLWILYPLLITWVVVATGNHYLFDAVLGAATAGLAYLGARQLSRAREGWAFRPRRAEAVA